MPDTIPFAWEMRLSKKAKRPRITINAYGKVELVWPIHMAQRHVSSMLHQHQVWVLNQLSKVKNVKKAAVMPPETIWLQSIDQIWQVKYEQTKSERVSITEKAQALRVCGDIQNQEAVRKALCRWVKKQGQQHLTYWLADVAESMNLSYKSLSIRLQKRRWGSCSSSKRINLNAALLFLPPLLVEHVLVHELTHLSHLNHSSSFWAGVEKHDQDYRTNRRLLRKHAADAPTWLTESFDVSNEPNL